MTISPHLPAGTLAAGPFTIDLSPARAQWEYTGLRVIDLEPGQSMNLTTQDEEMLVLPMQGSCEVSIDGQAFALTGRANVFASPSDFVYAPIDADVSITSTHGGRFALPAAKAQRQLTARYQSANDIPIELRGAGSCSRQIVNVCTPDSFEADRLIVVEAYVPSGNWATFPPHKHDSASESETALEEIYFFQIAEGPDGPGLAYHRQHSSDTRPLDLTAEVRSGDVVLVPYGWHGPTMAAPGYDAYWLNVMAGPERTWLICEEPAHSWVREAWADQAMDARLPFPGFEGGAVNPQWGR